MKIGLHPERQAETARLAFREYRPDDEQDRAEEIEALPVVYWQGRQLRTLRCHGTRGKGSHLVNVPEALLWSLIALTGWCCPYHAGDQAKGETVGQPPCGERLRSIL